MVHRMDMKADIYNNNDDNNDNDNDSNNNNNNNNNNSNDIYMMCWMCILTHIVVDVRILYTLLDVSFTYIYIVLIYNVMPENCTT